ncbi:MAG TPA: hypothetical protein VGQ83_08335 [Polyangia bacterium]|jgi:hypothetical protein
MNDTTALVPLREARERTIARLTELFAHDELDLEEFERRVTLAHTAGTLVEVEAVMDGLAPGAQAGTSSSRALVPAAAVEPSQRVLAVLGGVNREGAWTPARRIKVRAVLGGVVLDFREANLAPGVIDVEVATTLGGVEIIVPPWLAVQTEGSAVLGGFDHVSRSAPRPDPEAPLLRVHGLAFLGGVAVRMRLPGESERASHRRERRALREERRQRRLRDRNP